MVKVRSELFKPIIHIVVILLAYRGMYLLRQYTDLIPFVQLRIPIFDSAETMRFALFSGLLFVALGFSQDMYTLFRPSQHSYKTFLQSRLLRVMLSGFVAWIGFGYLFVAGISRFVLIFASVASLIGISIVDQLWVYLRRRFSRRAPYRLLIASKLVDRSLIDQLSWTAEYELQPITLDQLEHTDVQTRDGCLLIDSIDADELQRLSDFCAIRGKDLYHLPEGHFLEDILTTPVHLGPIMTLAYIASPLSGRRRVVKRGSDVLFSFLLLIVLSPIFIIIALLIKLDSPGPVLYIHERIGKNKREFRFIKFRSMYTHLSTGAAYGGQEAAQLYDQLIHSGQNIREGILPKIDNDPRITRLGTFLRKTSLDELPSLRSVLIGDMSLVGPRPHLPREVAQYAPWHQRLFTVKPGITGYAQLYGRDRVPFDEEARLDLRYIQHRSARLDIYILFATLKVVFGGK